VRTERPTVVGQRPVGERAGSDDDTQGHGRRRR
jgi:hypothetical protein